MVNDSVSPPLCASLANRGMSSRLEEWVVVVVVVVVVSSNVSCRPRLGGLGLRVCCDIAAAAHRLSEHL